MGFSFVIPHREEESIEATVLEIKKIGKKLKMPYEIIVSSGNHPSLQRNICAKQASKDYLYFIDNDSKINERSLILSYELLRQEKTISVLGGPCLLLKPCSFFELCVQEALSNELVVGKIASRYRSIGKKRLTNSSEIILCNLIVKKNDFELVGGFNLKLYPNEENDLVDRFSQQNKRVLYHPQVYVEKPHRKNLWQFVKQMSTYGRGRAEQTKANSKKNYFHPSFYSLLLVVSLIGALFYLPLNVFVFFIENGTFLYGLYLFYIFAKSSVKRKRFLFYLPLTIFCCHFFYLSSFLIGLMRKGFQADEKRKHFKLKIFQ